MYDWESKGDDQDDTAAKLLAPDKRAVPLAVNEQLSQVVDYLKQHHRGEDRLCMTSQVEQALNFSISTALREKLQGHGRVGVVPDGRTVGYFFQSKFPEVTDMESLRECFRSRGVGIPKTHFREDASYPEVIDDINQLIKEGKVSERSGTRRCAGSHFLGLGCAVGDRDQEQGTRARDLPP